MEKQIRLLAVVLGVQVLLALAVWTGGGNLSAKTDNSPLLALNGNTVDRITIDGPDEAKVTIAKAKGVWKLPDSDNFPADSGRVEQLLTRLKGFKQGAPVANSEEARKRFKVSDKAFERRITLAEGTKPLATLLVGTPAGRESHVREAGDKAVHLVQFNAYDAPAKANDWEDKTVLQVPKDEIVAIGANGLELERAPKTDPSESKTSENGKPTKAAPTWQVVSSTPATLKPDAADKLAKLLAELRIGSVLGKEDQGSYGLKTPKLTLSVTRKNGERLAYQLGKMPGKEDYVLKVSNRDEYFELPTYTAEPLLQAAKPDTLFSRTAMAKSGVSSTKK
jgi:hypothetical protein